MDTDIIVVGLGAAGLAASLRLAEHSVKVIALDGRDRSGGRVRWERVGTVDTPAELGAEYIHGDAPETSAFLAAAGLTYVATGDQRWLSTGRRDLRLDDGDDSEPDDLFEHARTLPHDESVSAFLKRYEDRPALGEQVKRARTFVEGFEAADASIASARAIAEELSSGVDDVSHRPVGSYAPLMTHVEERCRRAGADVRLGVTVEAIAWQRGSVTVTTRVANGQRATLRARGAIVTVPVGVLQQSSAAVPLVFDPPLPAEKRAAIDGLAMGQVVRVVLAFRSAFWESLDGGRYRDAAFFRNEASPYNAFWTQWPLRDRTIVAWAGGPLATAVATRSDDERIALARDEFAEMFGAVDRARTEFEGGVTHDWARDPFACGAYSYVVTGATSARSALGTPIEDALFFAGEATSTDGQGGTVSGAFGSGQRAADEALRVFATTVEPSRAAS